MSTKAIVERFWKSWNDKDWAALEATIAPEWKHHVGSDTRSLADFKEGSARVLGSMPDYTITPQAIVVEGDLAAVRWIGKGTHTAPYMGEKPTNRTIVIHGTHFHRVADGKIAEDWELIDNYAVAVQVGLIPI